VRDSVVPNFARDWELVYANDTGAYMPNIARAAGLPRGPTAKEIFARFSSGAPTSGNNDATLTWKDFEWLVVGDCVSSSCSQEEILNKTG